MKKESWEDKIRNNYKGIISDGQIEATIRYWRDFVNSVKEEERGRIYTEEVIPNIKCELCLDSVEKVINKHKL